MSKPQKQKPVLLICAAQDSSYIVRKHNGGGPLLGKMFIPFMNPNDSRLFVRNGELIKPYGVVEFEFEKLETCAELPHDRAFYIERGRTEFDPAGTVPIKYFDIERVADDLNAAQAIADQSFPDKASNENGSANANGAA